MSCMMICPGTLQSSAAAPVTKLSRRAKRRAREEMEAKMGMQEIMAASDASTRASSPSGASSISSFSHRTVTTSDLGLDIVTPVSSPERTAQSLPSPVLWRTHDVMSSLSMTSPSQLAGVSHGIASQRTLFSTSTRARTGGNWSLVDFDSSSSCHSLESRAVQSACFTTTANPSVDPGIGDASQRIPLAPLAANQTSGAWTITPGNSSMSASHAMGEPTVLDASQRTPALSQMQCASYDGQPVVVSSYPATSPCRVPICDASQRNAVRLPTPCIVGTCPPTPASTVGGSTMGDASERSPAWNMGSACGSQAVSVVSPDGVVAGDGDALKSWLCGGSGPLPCGDDLAEQLRAAAPEVYDD